MGDGDGAGFTVLRPFDDAMAEDIVLVGRQMHAETKIHCYMELDAARLLAHFRQARDDTDLWFRAAFVGETLVGAMLATAVAPYFSLQKIAKDLGLFVYPQWRHTRAAWVLVRAFEAWAWTRPGVVMVQLNQATGIEQDTTRRFYEAMGYQVQGCIACKLK